MQIILFEDNHINQLYPITLTRAGFEISCGGVNLYNLVRRYFRTQRISYLVREYLGGVVASRCPFAKIKGNDFLFINACLGPSIKNLKEIVKKLSKPGIILENEGRIAGARILGRVKENDIEKFFGEYKGRTRKIKAEMFNYPWDVIVYNKEILRDNIEWLAASKSKNGVYVGKNVVADKNIVLDPSRGPIYIDDGVEIFPFVNIEGPVYIGKKSKIKTFSDIKDGVMIGDVCKVGGEVEASVIESYSNKQHAGFLGHAYVGSWVNIGAGTSNSDLKNTYGTIKVSQSFTKFDKVKNVNRKIDTGLQFLGCIIGDYSKAGINTSVMTGKVIGVNANVIGVVAEDVPSFTNLTPAGKFEYDLDGAIKVQKRMFARRDIRQTAVDKKMMKEVSLMTREERKGAGVRKGRVKL